MYINQHFTRILMFLFITSTTLTAGNKASDIHAVNTIQDSNYTGRGNQREVLIRSVINLNNTSAVTLKKLVINLNGTTNLSDIQNIHIYTTNNSDQFDSRNPQATLLGTIAPHKGNLTLKTNHSFTSKDNYIWITCDIKESATEGNKVDASLVSITINKEKFNVTNGNPSGDRTILLARKIVFAPGDYNSTNYRIPAIVTAKDGSLVTLTDKRKFNSTDLPEDIDIVARRSTDGGKTWSEPVTVAQGTGRYAGYGDAVVTRALSGKLIAVYVGGTGLWASTAENPNRTYVSTSDDNGISWSAPREITNQIFGASCADPERSKWKASFCGSGQGLCLRNGRIMVVGAVVIPGMKGLQNFAYYSDDEGVNWKVSNMAIAGGDEAKVVELNNGDILMSSRTTGNRLWAISKDGGVNWGPKNTWTDIWGNACDGDIIRYTSTKDGRDKDRLLHTLPNDAKRKNVSIFMSYDEGKTWPVKKTLCAGESAYSSITILPDGTIGAYIEEDETKPYTMVYVNFSLKWMSNGTDAIR